MRNRSCALHSKIIHIFLEYHSFRYTYISLIVNFHKMWTKYKPTVSLVFVLKNLIIVRVITRPAWIFFSYINSQSWRILDAYFLWRHLLTIWNNIWYLLHFSKLCIFFYKRSLLSLQHQESLMNVQALLQQHPKSRGGMLTTVDHLKRLYIDHYFQDEIDTIMDSCVDLIHSDDMLDATLSSRMMREAGYYVLAG